MVTFGAVSYFLPVFAFLLVFIVVYALLKKTEILGGSEPVMIFISFILASFFIVEASLVEYVKFSGAWFAVIIIAVFFLVLIFGLLPGDNPFGEVNKKSWIGWVVVGLIVALFVISSAYVFHWAVNWDTLSHWADSDWFGMVLLLIIAALVAWKIAGKSD